MFEEVWCTELFSNKLQIRDKNCFKMITHYFVLDFIYFFLIKGLYKGYFSSGVEVVYQNFQHTNLS